ncbi:MAG: hypothetical protein WC506_03675 [Candidatus Micrarchaeia archaeon]
MHKAMEHFGIFKKGHAQPKIFIKVEYAGGIRNGRFERLIAGEKRPYGELVKEYERTTRQYENSFGNLEPMLYVCKEGEFGTMGTMDFEFIKDQERLYTFKQDLFVRIDKAWKFRKTKEKLKSRIGLCQAILYEDGVNCIAPNKGAATELGRELEKIGVQRHAKMVISRTDEPAMERVFVKRGWDKFFTDNRGNVFYGKFLE